MRIKINSEITFWDFMNEKHFYPKIGNEFVVHKEVVLDDGDNIEAFLIVGTTIGEIVGRIERWDEIGKIEIMRDNNDLKEEDENVLSPVQKVESS